VIALCHWRFIDSEFGHFFIGIFKLQKLFQRYVAIVVNLNNGHNCTERFNKVSKQYRHSVFVEASLKFNKVTVVVLKHPYM